MFFATQSDLLPILRDFEEGFAIKLVKYGHHRTAKPRAQTSLREIPDLGTADEDSATFCRKYLVFRQGDPVTPRDLGGLPFTARYAFDQLANPDSIVFSPGGFHGPECLLSGEFTTAYTSAACAELMKRARKAVKQHTTRVKAFHVGPEARKALDSGVRLTMSVQSSREFDLAL